MARNKVRPRVDPSMGQEKFYYWVVRDRLFGASVGRKYGRTLYWASRTLVLLGYDDVTPVSNAETFYVVVVVLMGALFGSSLLANFLFLFRFRNARYAAYTTHVDNAREYMRSRNIPRPLRHQVMAFFSYSWSAHHSLDGEEALRLMPKHLQSKVVSTIKASRIKQVCFLTKESIEFVNMLALALVRRVYSPGDQIIEPKINAETFFVIRGKAVVSAFNGSNAKEFSAGDFFADACLLDPEQYEQKAVAKTFCELYVLAKSKFDEALTEFYRGNEADKTLMSSHSLIAEVKTTNESGRGINWRLPGSYFSVLWDSARLVAIIYVAFEVPYFAVFISMGNEADIFMVQQDVSLRYLLTFLVEALFGIDLILRAHYFSYLDPNVMLNVVQPSLIFEMYKSNGFYIDLVAWLPVGLVLDTLPGTAHRYSAIFRLLHGDSLLGDMAAMSALTRPECLEQATQFYNCTWVIFDCYSHIGVTFPVESPDSMYQASFAYLRSLYWAVVTLTAVGYGDIVAYSTAESYFAAFWIFVGGIINFGVVGAMSSTISNAMAPHHHYMEKINTLNHVLERMEISEHLSGEVRRFYHQQFTGRKQCYESQLLLHLPDQLCYKISSLLHSEAVKCISLFNSASNEFLKEVTGKFRHRSYQNGETICLEGDVCRDFFVFLNNSKVNVYFRLRKAPVRALCSGDSYAQISGDVNEMKAKAEAAWVEEQNLRERIVANLEKLKLQPHSMHSPTLFYQRDNALVPKGTRQIVRGIHSMRNQFTTAWNALVTCWNVYNAFFVIFRVCFHPHLHFSSGTSTAVWVADLCCDICFALDIYLRFITSDVLKLGWKISYNGKRSTSSIVGVRHSISPLLVMLYAKSFYWATTTLLLVGSRESVPRDTAGTLWTGSRACVARSLSGTFFETFAKIHELPPTLRERITYFFRVQFEHTKGSDLFATVHDLSANLRLKLMLEIYGNSIANLPICRFLTASQVNNLALRLKPELFIPGDNILVEGTYGNRLCTLRKGMAAAYWTNSVAAVAILMEGAFFGEIAFFLPNQRRLAAVRATTFCEVLNTLSMPFSAGSAADSNGISTPRFDLLIGRSSYFLRLQKRKIQKHKKSNHINSPRRMSQAEVCRLFVHPEVQLLERKAEYLLTKSDACAEKYNPAIASIQARRSSSILTTVRRSLTQSRDRATSNGSQWHSGNTDASIVIKKSDGGKSADIRLLQFIVDLNPLTKHKSRPWLDERGKTKVGHQFSPQRECGSTRCGISERDEDHFEARKNRDYALTVSVSGQPRREKRRRLSVAMVNDRPQPVPSPQPLATLVRITRRHSFPVIETEFLRIRKLNQASSNSKKRASGIDFEILQRCQRPQYATQLHWYHRYRQWRVSAKASVVRVLPNHSTTSASRAVDTRKSKSPAVSPTGGRKIRSFRSFRSPRGAAMGSRLQLPSQRALFSATTDLQSTVFIRRVKELGNAWDFLMLMVAVYHLIVTPFKISFSPALIELSAGTLRSWSALEVFLDFLCFVDAVYQLQHASMMQKNVFSAANSSKNGLRHALTVNPELRLLPVSEELLYFMRGLSSYLATGHLLACIWFITSETGFHQYGTSWLATSGMLTYISDKATVVEHTGRMLSQSATSFSLESVSLMRKYLRSLLFSIECISTLFYGDILSMNPLELVAEIVITFWSIYIYGALVGAQAELLDARAKSEAKFEQRLGELHHYVLQNDVPKTLRRQIKAYYARLWVRGRGESEFFSVEKVSRVLYEDVVSTTLRHFAAQVKAFRGLEEHFLRALLVCLHIAKVVPPTAENMESRLQFSFVLKSSMKMMANLQSLHPLEAKDLILKCRDGARKHLLRCVTPVSSNGQSERSQSSKPPKEETYENNQK
ncbi:Cyclic nucleotide-binding-like [Phytophthora cactorum]|nr:Cyclic nucleotide-binding-like [Phytophthora cactorum]